MSILDVFAKKAQRQVFLGVPLENRVLLAKEDYISSKKKSNHEEDTEPELDDNFEITHTKRLSLGQHETELSCIQSSLSVVISKLALVSETCI